MSPMVRGRRACCLRDGGEANGRDRWADCKGVKGEILERMKHVAFFREVNHTHTQYSLHYFLSYQIVFALNVNYRPMFFTGSANCWCSVSLQLVLTDLACLT